MCHTEANLEFRTGGARSCATGPPCAAWQCRCRAERRRGRPCCANAIAEQSAAALILPEVTPVGRYDSRAQSAGNHSLMSVVRASAKYVAAATQSPEIPDVITSEPA